MQRKKIKWIEEQKFSYPGFQGILFSDSLQQSITPQLKWPMKSLLQHYAYTTHERAEFESETIVWQRKM